MNSNRSGVETNPGRDTELATGRRWWWLAGLVLLAVGARLAFVRTRLLVDIDDYLSLADSLWTTHTYGRGTAFRPPLYPLVLAPLRGLRDGFSVGIALLHACLGGLTTAVVFWTARNWRLGLGAYVAAGIVALDPLLLYWSGAPMSETLAACLVALAVLAIAQLERPIAWAFGIVAGLGLGLGALCRPTWWATALLVVLASLLVPGEHRIRRGVAAIVAMLVMMVVQFPWWLRNWKVFGAPVLMTTHGGYTLLLGNNDSFYGELRAGKSGWAGEKLSAWQKSVRQQFDELYLPQLVRIPGGPPRLIPPKRQSSLPPELEYDRFCYEQAIATIRARPADFWCSVWHRTVSFWRLFPQRGYGRVVQLGSGCFYVAVFVLMLVGLFRGSSWSWPRVVCVLVPLSFWLVHSVYWCDMRMRAPVMPAIALLAGMGAEALRGWRTN
jgi:4-amino-4-deoxy-L-arabinose transferase-like glycosyltransferase